MFYVYLIQSQNNPKKRYTGYTTDLKTRIAKHNEGGANSTKDDKPWKLKAYLAFQHEPQARSFEQDLKSGSGRAFANTRLWPKLENPP
jgi:putative endonuclease